MDNQRSMDNQQNLDNQQSLITSDDNHGRACAASSALGIVDVELPGHAPPGVIREPVIRAVAPGRQSPSPDGRQANRAPENGGYRKWRLEDEVG
jgi:hypothetical protein